LRERCTLASRYFPKAKAQAQMSSEAVTAVSRMSFFYELEEEEEVIFSQCLAMRSFCSTIAPLNIAI